MVSGRHNFISESIIRDRLGLGGEIKKCQRYQDMSTDDGLPPEKATLTYEDPFSEGDKSDRRTFYVESRLSGADVYFAEEHHTDASPPNLEPTGFFAQGSARKADMYREVTSSDQTSSKPSSRAGSARSISAKATSSKTSVSSPRATSHTTSSKSKTSDKNAIKSNPGHSDQSRPRGSAASLARTASTQRTLKRVTQPAFSGQDHTGPSKQVSDTSVNPKNTQAAELSTSARVNDWEKRKRTAGDLISASFECGNNITRDSLNLDATADEFLESLTSLMKDDFCMRPDQQAVVVHFIIDFEDGGQKKHVIKLHNDFEKSWPLHVRDVYSTLQTPYSDFHVVIITRS